MKHILPEGYYARPATIADVDATAKMLNASFKQFVSGDMYTPMDLENEWGEPGYNLETDSRLVIAPDKQVVAFFEVWDPSDPHTRVYCWGRVHPAHADQGIGAYLLEWVEERARQAIPKAPSEARVVLLSHILSRDESTQDLFRQAGLAFIRHSLRMVIDLNGKPPEPHWPTGISVRTFLVEQDQLAVFQAVQDSFKDHWGYLQRPFEEEFARWKHMIDTDPELDPSLWFLALDGEEIAGVSLCRPQRNDDPGMGWVNTLGVRRPWRRRGLGLALLQHSFREFYRRGKFKVGLGVDAESLTGATRLYLKAGMRPDPAHQYSLYEKELRPGTEISTQAIQYEMESTYIE